MKPKTYTITLTGEQLDKIISTLDFASGEAYNPKATELSAFFKVVKEGARVK